MAWEQIKRVDGTAVMHRGYINVRQNFGIEELYVNWIYNTSGSSQNITIIKFSEMDFSKYRYRIRIMNTAYPYTVKNGTAILESKPSVPATGYNTLATSDYMSSAITFYVLVEREAKNAIPTITPTTTPKGIYSNKPSFDYTVADADSDTMTVTESIDGIAFNTRTNVTSGSSLTFTPTDLTWLRTRINQTVNVTIKADDGKGGVTTVNYPITRTTPAIDLQLKTPFETDVVARRLLLQLEGEIPNDAIVSVQACNNAFDTNPTWENATNLVLSGSPYPFSNTTKTATKWGVSFKVRIERGGSTQPIYIDGVGGAFD